MSTSRWRAITAKFRADIESGRLAPGDQLPSSAAVAESCGVSRLTAHRAVEELQRLGLVTRDGRRGTIVTPRELPTTKRIALIVDQVDFIQSFPRPEMLSGIHAGLGEDYDLVLCDSKANPQREIELLNRMSEETDGILCWPMDNSRAATTLNAIAARGFPLVLLDRIPHDVTADAVLTDSVTATRQAVEFLLDRGHRRIALLTFDKPEVTTVEERYGTFEAILEERGLAAPELIRRFPTSLEVSQRAYFDQVVRDALYTLVRSPDPATAVLCVQDMFGVAVLSWAAEVDLLIPDALEVVTFNDWPPSWLKRPWQAHRISVQPEQMGRVAIASLRSQIARTAGEPTIHRIPAKFIAVDAALTISFESIHSKTKEG